MKKRLRILAILCLAISLLIPTGSAFGADVSVNKVIVQLKDNNIAEMSLLQWGDFMEILMGDQASIRGIVTNTNLPFTLLMWGELYPDELEYATTEYQWNDALVRGTIQYKEVNGQDWYEFVPPAVPAPTASAFSIGGGTGVTTVNGALNGNAITFTVDPSATYTTASVTVSADVYVTVTKYGETTPSRTDVNVEKGTLTADAGMLSAFSVTKTSATGQELISQTASGPITVLLKSQADQTKTTTYTVNFAAAQ